MEKFREAIIILFASYEIKYSLEKGRSKDKTEHFVFVQSFLQEFEENPKVLHKNILKTIILVRRLWLKGKDIWKK
ncbi:hypothetical protein H9W95_10415 [Flavobacterium lindanitolerans]|nr:hypothetical protein [Flavobacterium lindanitolerans]